MIKRAICHYQMKQIRSIVFEISSKKWAQVEISFLMKMKKKKNSEMVAFNYFFSKTLQRLCCYAENFIRLQFKSLKNLKHRCVIQTSMRWFLIRNKIILLRIILLCFLWNVKKSKRKLHASTKNQNQKKNLLS